MTEDAKKGDDKPAENVKPIEPIDIQRVLNLLPHRYPFLMVDRIVDYRGEEFGIGIKNVTFNEPHFQGHFPGAPIMPGVLILEGMAQTAGALCILASDMPVEKVRVFFMTIDKAKFRRPVVPGDVLEYHMTRLTKRRNMWWYRGEGRVAGELVCEAELSAMISVQ